MTTTIRFALSQVFTRRIAKKITCAAQELILAQFVVKSEVMVTPNGNELTGAARLTV